MINQITPLIEGEALSLVYPEKTVLKEISLKIFPGEMVSLIGPNGAGKTSLVRLLLRLIKPTQGRVVYQTGLKLGYVPQRFMTSSYLPMDVTTFLHLAENIREADFTYHIEHCGISHLLKTQLHRLSGGELQRVLLARALLRSPDFLVLDEPTQGVDVSGQTEFYRMLNKLRQEKPTLAILLVSHELYYVMGNTDRVICLNQHICCAGLPEHVGSHPAFLALYTHHHNHHHDLSGKLINLKEIPE